MPPKRNASGKRGGRGRTRGRKYDRFNPAPERIETVPSVVSPFMKKVLKKATQRVIEVEIPEPESSPTPPPIIREEPKQPRGSRRNKKKRDRFHPEVQEEKKERPKLGPLQKLFLKKAKEKKPKKPKVNLNDAIKDILEWTERKAIEITLNRRRFVQERSNLVGRFSIPYYFLRSEYPSTPERQAYLNAVLASDELSTISLSVRKILYRHLGSFLQWLKTYAEMSLEDPTKVVRIFVHMQHGLVRDANMVTDSFISYLKGNIRLDWLPINMVFGDLRLIGSDPAVFSTDEQLMHCLPWIPSVTVEIRQISKSARSRFTRKGSWAPWKHTLSFLNLSKYQIAHVDDKEPPFHKEHCFVYALEQSGSVDETILKEIKMAIYGASLRTVDVKRICQQFHLSVKIRSYTDHSYSYLKYEYGEGECILIGLYDNHYFIEDKIGISHWVLNNPQEAERMGEHPRYGWKFKENHQFDSAVIYSVGSILQKMKELGLLVPLSPTDEEFLTNTYYKSYLMSETDLSYAEKFCKPIEKPKTADNDVKIWFADFETTTNDDKHLPYMLCCCGEDNERFVTEDFHTTIENVDQIWSHKLMQMLNFVHRRSGDKEINIYFHNLTYDMAFIIPFLPTDQPFDLVEIGGRMLGFKAFIPQIRTFVYFKDSYALISSPLRDFGKMFNLEIEKEIFPYDFYTSDNFKKLVDGRFFRLEEYVEYYHDREALTANLQRTGCIDGELVDVHKYAVFYCLHDCWVLRDGFKKFREQIREVTELDIVNYLTLPSIAYSFLRKEGVFEGCYNLCGQPLFFMRKCILGGRCMLARNEKQNVMGNLSDFDAVSLYPSSMARIYTLKGLPKVIPLEMSLEELFTKDGFFALFEISAVPTHLDFPLLAKEDENGIKRYDNLPGQYYLDDISLRSIMEFHNVSMEHIKVIRGYYYDEGKNETIQGVIRHLFDQRNILKQQNNPLEKIYKLLMNSCYGKSIIRPITERVRVVSNEGFESIVLDNATATLSYRNIGNKYVMKLNKNIISAESFPSFGIHILAMSKRIMSEVMALAQEKDIQVYYTDTDSIHLNNEDIYSLSQCYKERYGRELIGSDMGQFHTDFPVHKNGNMFHSIHFIGVGKKSYIDKLYEPVSGEIRYHIRMKGIPESVIKVVAEEEFDNNPMEIYTRLEQGEDMTFDLLCNRCSFQLNHDFSYSSRREFKRKVKF